MYLLTVSYMIKVYNLQPVTYTLGKLISFYTRKIAGQSNKHLAQNYQIVIISTTRYCVLYYMPGNFK